MRVPRSVRLTNEEYLMLVTYFGSFTAAIKYLLELIKKERIL